MWTNLGLARDWCDIADLAAFEGIDNAAFANVWVSNESDGYLLLVRVQLRELAEKLNEGALPEGVVRRGMEGKCGVSRGEVLDVPRGDPIWYEIAFVDDEYDLLV